MQEVKGRANQLSQQLTVGICVWQGDTGCVYKFVWGSLFICSISVLCLHTWQAVHTPAVSLHPQVKDLLCCGL